MKSILVVDDAKVIRFLYAEELKDEGYEVFTTNDYNELSEVVKNMDQILSYLTSDRGK